MSCGITHNLKRYAAAAAVQTDRLNYDFAIVDCNQLDSIMVLWYFIYIIILCLKSVRHMANDSLKGIILHLNYLQRIYNPIMPF